MDNPFFNYLTPQLFPGQLRNQRQVSLGSLIRPYPHYGPLYEIGNHWRGRALSFARIEGAEDVQPRLQLPVRLRVHPREAADQQLQRSSTIFANTFRWQDSNQPRHRVTAAGTWDLPFGKGRPFSAMLRGRWMRQSAVGSWQACGRYSTGAFVRFGNLIANGNPCLDNPTPERWFDTSAFSRLPANTYVIRTNPMQYDCLTGRRFSQLDATLTKDFAVTESVRVELKMAAYNATNSLNRAGPNTDINSSQFGTGAVPGHARVQLRRADSGTRQHHRTGRWNSGLKIRF